jgi:hypothetical protein
VITGRGPGAPGVTSGGKFTRGRVAAGDPGDGAVDLGEIRRSEEIIGMLGARAAMPAQLLRDPAVALLSSLVADVGGADLGSADLGGADAGRAVLGPAPAISRWARVAAAGAVIAGVAGTTSVVAAGMMARLARGPASELRRSMPVWGVLLRPRRTR